MSDILTPEEVDELRPANEPKYLMQNTTQTRLIALIDALAEALRAADREIMGVMSTGDPVAVLADSIALLDAYHDRRCGVAAWLEAECEHS